MPCFTAAIVIFPDYYVPDPKVHRTPRLPAARHTVTRRTRDANYATIFIFWDRIFKIFQTSDPKELENPGVPGGNPDFLNFKRFYSDPLSAKQAENASSYVSI